MTDYQRKTLVPLANVGLPGPVPHDLDGLMDVSLADVTLAVGVPAATQLGYLNTGFFPVPAPPTGVTVNAGAFRVALRRAGVQVQFQNAVNALGNEFKDWYDHQPTFTLGDVFITAVGVQAGGAVQSGMAANFAVAASAQPA
jgi:hypothetical protein